MYAEQLALLITDDDGETFPVAVLYRCHPCEHRTGRPHLWRVTLKSRTRPEHTHPDAQPCATCARPNAGTVVRGTYSAARRCDDRCMYAKGPDCECSCGGKNHGRGYQFAV